MWALSQAGGGSREGERGRCSRLTEFYARVHAYMVDACFIRMKAIFYVHERVLQLHRPIATGILRGLACQATKKKRLQS